MEEGDIIAVDAGTTALEFADVIKDKFKNLTVI
ncbi:MAG: DeoR/GlpR transcriptional regulator, partial [Clostridia bacterium]|nr:DeoR/GlpR transcriptional regulator [Clostridia bacterium]